MHLNWKQQSRGEQHHFTNSATVASNIDNANYPSQVEGNIIEGAKSFNTLAKINAINHDDTSVKFPTINLNDNTYPDAFKELMSMLRTVCHDIGNLKYNPSQVIKNDIIDKMGAVMDREIDIQIDRRKWKGC